MPHARSPQEPCLTARDDQGGTETVGRSRGRLLPTMPRSRPARRRVCRRCANASPSRRSPLEVGELVATRIAGKPFPPVAPVVDGSPALEYLALARHFLRTVAPLVVRCGARVRYGVPPMRLPTRLGSLAASRIAGLMLSNQPPTTGLSSPLRRGREQGLRRASLG